MTFFSKYKNQILFSLGIVSATSLIYLIHKYIAYRRLQQEETPILFEMAWNKIQKKKYREAIPLLKAVVDKGAEEPSSEEYVTKAHELLGYYLLKEGSRYLDEASEHCKYVIEREPNSATAHQALGFILYQQDSFEEGIEHFKIATKLDPQNVEVKEQLCLALMTVGRIEEAAQLWPEIPEPKEFDDRSLYMAIFAKQKELQKEGKKDLSFMCLKELVRRRKDPKSKKEIEILGQVFSAYGKHLEEMYEKIQKMEKDAPILKHE